jgi:hypothetical protein
MVFRKYYNASLAPHTSHMQKAISKVLTCWWREDPFEAEWAIDAWKPWESEGIVK